MSNLEPLDNSEEFLGRLANREEEAWAQLIDGWDPMLKGIIHSTLLRYNFSYDRADARVEDIAQETWIVLYNKFNEMQFENLRHIFGWLKGVQENVIRNIVRKGKEKEAYIYDMDESGETLPEGTDRRPTEATVVSSILRSQREAQFYAALAQVVEEAQDATEQQIIALYMTKHEKSSHIAEKLNVERNTVYRVVERAKRKMIRYLQAEALFTTPRNLD